MDSTDRAYILGLFNKIKDGSVTPEDALDELQAYVEKVVVTE